jgi:hypothetical protein
VWYSVFIQFFYRLLSKSVGHGPCEIDSHAVG